MVATTVPGTSVTLECLASGYDINQHHIHWTTQPTETGLVYTGGFRPRDPVIVVNKFNGRVALFTTGSTSKLRIDGLTAQDMTIYYCARGTTMIVATKSPYFMKKMNTGTSRFPQIKDQPMMTLSPRIQRKDPPDIMKYFNYISLVILLLMAGVSATITLTQPPAALALPGRSITLTCTASGYNINDHHLSWIRQSNGKKLVFITAFRTGYTTYTANEFKGRVTPSTHGSTAQLRIDALKVEDTATYYCARDTMTEFGSVPAQYLVGGPTYLLDGFSSPLS
ncbi:putative IgW heavy chain V region W26 protein, partial [Naja naja]